MNYVYVGIFTALSSALAIQFPAQIDTALGGSNETPASCAARSSQSRANQQELAKDPAGLGIVKCDGGTESVTFDSGSIPYSEDPNIAGTLQNSMGAVITDCTVRIKAVGANCNPPNGETVKINGVQESFNNGYAHITDLNIQSGADDIPIRIDVGSVGNPCEEFKLTFQASVSVAPTASLHQDGLGQYLFSATQYSITRKIADPGNAGLHCVARHSATEESQAELNGLSGWISFDSADSLSVTDVFLRAVAGGTISSVPGATVTTQGNSFSITNFSLSPGEEYHVVVLFSGVPTKAVELKLNAAFSSD